MADEIVKNAEFTGMKKNDGEDPIIVAQRFLNIFKQLHIFNEERKNNFNEMLMELKPEIRGMFASLPGGSLLQEYVDDLEKKSGKVRDRSLDSAPMDTLSDNNNILETALKEAKEQEPGAAAVPKEGVKISADTNFAKEMAEALKEAGIVGGSSDLSIIKQALEINEESRRKETAEITKAIAESQMKMAQMMVQHNTANTNANNIQIHTAGGNFPPVEELVGGIVKAQSELFANMAKTQTAELSSIISLALRESHQLSTKSIIDALATFQKENLKILRGMDDDELEDLETKYRGKNQKSKDKKNKRQKEEKEWEFKDSSGKFSLDQSLFEFDDMINIPEEEEEITIDDEQEDAFDENKDEIETVEVEEIEELDNTNNDEEKGVEIEEADSEETLEQETVETTIDTEPKEIEEHISNSWTSSFAEDIEEKTNSENEEPAEEMISEEKGVEENHKAEKEKNIETYDDDNKDKTIDDDVTNKEEAPDKKELAEDKTIEEEIILDFDDEPIDLDKVEDLTEEKGRWGFDAETEDQNNDKIEEKKKKKKKKNKDKNKNKQKEKPEEEEWEWQEVFDDSAYENTEEETEKPLQEEKEEDYVIYGDTEDETTLIRAIGEDKSEEAIDTDEEWEWEYEEDNVSDKRSPTEAHAEPLEGEDGWEWEYEEDTENPLTEPKEQASSDKTEEEEWEWEYEEDPTPHGLKTESEEEWEWGYEEEDAATEPNIPQENEEEWEWEYEEDPNPTPVSEEQDSEKKGNSNDKKTDSTPKDDDKFWDWEDDTDI